MYAIIGAGTGLSVYLSIIIARDYAPILAGLGIVTYVLGLRHGVDADHIVALDNLLENRGFLNRYFRPLFRIVKRPWQIYPIGCLFGLGFDTASEIALLGISVGVGLSSAVPLWTIIILPLTFTCGMVLVDASDGVLMRVAYGWAFLNPLRKIYYNLTVTLISILVAIVIGTLELLSVLANELRLAGPLWTALGNLNFESIGYSIIGIFLSAWIVSLSYWKYKRFDELKPIRLREPLIAE